MEEKSMIEGRRPVLEALRAKSKITRLMLQKGSRGEPVAEIIRLAGDLGVPVDYWEKSRLDKLSATRNHQGVMAEAPPFCYTPFEDLLAAAGKAPFVILLDHIQDPYNLGALIRTAYACGCHGVVIPRRRAAQITASVLRAASGAAVYVPVASVVNLSRCAEECKEAGLWVYGADMAGDTVYSRGDYRAGTALVIGGEGEGISRLMKEKCDHLIRLPMQGQVASLNASVAGGLLMYEVFRQRAGF